LDRSQKILLSIILIAIIATAGSSLFSANPIAYINPWMDTYYHYEKIGDFWVTHNIKTNYTMSVLFIPVNCKNNGATTATFNITITFEGALFSTNTPQPYWQINSTAASFEFTLKVGEQQTTPVHFQIDGNADRFIISLSLDTDQNNLFIEPVRKENTFYGYKQLYYIWVPEYSIYAPALIE
jgi:hypothetical protein